MGCGNGGVCGHGLRNATEHELKILGEAFDPNNHHKFQHCKCPKGSFGIHCEIQVEECGEDKNCYHGGKCREHTSMIEGTQQVCDCTTANHKNSAFAGQECATEATTFCSRNEEESGFAFCTNNGDCKVDNGIHGCTCKEGYLGDHCEYSPDDESPNAECHIKCRNGGQCRKGFKKHGLLHNFDELTVLSNQTASHEALEHCACPTGMGGLYCDISVEVCGENEHTCLHGAKCVKNSEDKHACQCRGKTAGLHCQHKATTNCYQDHFCTNGGKCANGKKCKCPKGFSGDKCEVDLSLASASNYDDDAIISSIYDHQTPLQKAKNNAGIIAGSVIAAIGLFALFIGLLHRKRTNRQKDLEVIELGASPPKEAFSRIDIVGMEKAFGDSDPNMENVNLEGDGGVVGRSPQLEIL